MKNMKLCVLWLFLAFSTHPFLPHAQEIFYNGFHHAEDDLALDRVAQINDNGVLTLTKGSSSHTNGTIGHAFYGSPVKMKASPHSSAHSFSTVFAFSIVPEHEDLGGHGLAFAIAHDRLFLGADPSQYLGLLSADKLSNLSNFAFGVEFDTVTDLEFEDINDNHVGIDMDSLKSIAVVPARFYDDNNCTICGGIRDLNLKSGKTIFAWIDYYAPMYQVDVKLALSDQKPKHSILSYTVDLSPLLNEFMYVGFSASTGLLASSHHLMGWSFGVNRRALPLVSSTMPTLPITRSIST